MATAPTDDHRAALYDAQNTWADDDDFFLALVGRTPGSRVLDLGCGTGRLTVALAAAGHDVLGIDPDTGALAAARTKPGAEAVRWVEGTSADIPRGTRLDVAVLTSHVVQAIADDAEWAHTLADLHDALVPGGLLAFDSRDPAARAWERWNSVDSYGVVELPDGSRTECWFEVARVVDGVVTLEEHAVTPDGTHLVESGVLAFRSEASLRADLVGAGFVVESVAGGWHGEPVGAGVGELVVVARRGE